MDKKDEQNGGETGEVKPVVDVFGTERDASTGKPVVPEAPVVEVKKEGEAAKAGEGEAAKPEDIEKSPIVVELRGQIKKLEDDKSSMGGNLSEQRKAIDTLNKRLKDIEEGKAGNKGGEPLFKDIKRVKDLSKDEQEAMTDAEKKLFDELADTREAMNKVVKDAAEKEATATKTAAQEEEESVAAEAFNGKVQTEALRLSGNNKDMANAIIAEFNQFRDNDKLSEKELNARLEKAAKLVPDYKPPKEQKSPSGGAAKPVDNGSATDIDKIVQETAQGKGGGAYSL